MFNKIYYKYLVLYYTITRYRSNREYKVTSKNLFKTHTIKNGVTSYYLDKLRKVDPKSFEKLSPVADLEKQTKRSFVSKCLFWRKKLDQEQTVTLPDSSQYVMPPNLFDIMKRYDLNDEDVN